METALIIALLASNLWLIRRVLTKPDTTKPVKETPSPEPAKAADTKEEAENDSIVGKSTFDINEFKEVFREAAKEAAKEVIPLIIKEYGKPSDAGFPDEPEEKPSAQIPVEKLDEVFATHSASELTGDEIPSEEPRAGGSDFNEISTAVNVLKGNSDNPDDKETARRVLPDIQGTQIIEKIKLDPLVRKRILMIECQLPEIPGENNTADTPPSNPEEAKPKKKIVFHADIDTTGIDAIDFNILH
ncbi:hypothetical protein [uncultured Duncaniella sp.]|jgi:hypothetical protein|uniref:hypothetical protein n=1 Tax=uncultured Duncaniella sp. TaxID=2768039 RepID=UPI002711EC8F|nr:hypothetical protein [uncultured Duncaniella sp.]